MSRAFVERAKLQMPVKNVLFKIIWLSDCSLCFYRSRTPQYCRRTKMAAVIAVRIVSLLNELLRECQSPMRIVEKVATPFLIAFLLTTVAGNAIAQQPPQPPKEQQPRAPARPPAPPRNATPPQQQPVQDESPQRTTATYDDWIVQCQTQAGSPPQKVCEMAQVTQVEGRNIPFSRVAVVRPVKDQPVKLVVQVPVNVSFNANVRVQSSDSDAGLAAPFARCVPAGCFAEIEVGEDALRKLRAAAGAGKLSFADAGGRNISVPLSFKGFSQAFEALVKEKEVVP
jgi:invasion protein IalB